MEKIFTFTIIQSHSKMLLLRKPGGLASSIYFQTPFCNQFDVTSLISLAKTKLWNNKNWKHS